jgi:hypothetical protein
MNTQQFEIVSPGKLVLLLPAFIGLILPVAILVTLLVVAKDSKELLRAAPALLTFPLVAGALGWSMFRGKVTLSDRGLVLRRLPWSRAIKPAQLDLEQARIVNLDEHPELRPVLRMIGTSLPGFRSGWFWVKDRRTASVILTDQRRVLLLPRRDNKLILLSLQRPEALLEALRRYPR